MTSDPALHIDFETRSVVDLKRAGVHVYANHASTGIWCMAWRLGDEVGVWKPEDGGLPFPVYSHVVQGGRVVAHNAAFERLIWNRVMPRVHGLPLPVLTVEQMDCTMARCAALAIPGGLDAAAHILGTDNRKDTAGHANMLVLAKPMPRSPPGAPVWNTDPARLARQLEYCLQDVATEAEVDRRVPPLTARERRVWELDQKINDRGVAIDERSVRDAIQVAAAERERIDAELSAATAGHITAATQAVRILKWLQDRGCPVKSLDKENAPLAARWAQREGDTAAARVLALRKEGARAATAKFNAMLDCLGTDGRARGLLYYHGASTGRWAGRLIQPQNMYRTDPERDGDDITVSIEILGMDCAPAEKAAAIRAVTGAPPLEMLAKCTRSMIVAAPGHEYIGCDLSNIEGRLGAWAGDEKWKIKAFRAYDQGRGPDLYRVSYARSFGVADPATVSGPRRQVGKVTELSLQYQGSVGAWIKMAANYGVLATDVVPIVRAATPPGDWERVQLRYDSAPNKYRLGRDEWTAVSLIVMGWRDAHPGIVQSWWDLQDAAIDAVANPGAVTEAMGGKARYMVARDFLWCALPSGRLLAYARPVLRHDDTSFLTTAEGVRFKLADLREGEIEEHLDDGASITKQSRRRVDYEGFEGERKRWATMSLYGGMQFNHIIQGTARDILVEGMFDLEGAGYPLVLTVHDENLAEMPIGTGSPEEMAAIMSRVPSWIDGDLPLAAKAWRDVRYAK